MNKITLPTILPLCPKQKRKAFLLFCMGLILHDGFLFFAGSSNISDKGAVVSRQFCGPLGNTYSRWSRAGGTACRQRFALSILLACSHRPPNFSGVPEGMWRPFLDLLIRLLQPGMYSMCTWASIILLHAFPNKQKQLYVSILPLVCVYICMCIVLQQSNNKYILID